MKLNKDDRREEIELHYVKGFSDGYREAMKHKSE